MISLNKLSLGLLRDTKSQANSLKSNEFAQYEQLINKSIISVDFPENQYIKERTEKKQIVLHHTVSGQGVDGDIAYWRKTSDRIGTSVIIAWDGKIYQCFSTEYWAYHLGLKTANNTELNKKSIGIEIDSWGGLVEHKGKWYPAIWDTTKKKYIANIKVKAITNVVKFEKGYRGFYGYEKYTDAQIESVKKLLLYWGKKYNISLKYHEDMWDVSSNALKGVNGVWSHSSFRKDKSDCYPDEKLIGMLKSLE